MMYRLKIHCTYKLNGVSTAGKKAETSNKTEFWFNQQFYTGLLVIQEEQFIQNPYKLHRIF